MIYFYINKYYKFDLLKTKIIYYTMRFIISNHNFFLLLELLFLNKFTGLFITSPLEKYSDY